MKVVNVKDYGGVKQARAAGVVYIGRGSPLGNPYSHLTTSKATFKVATREEAIECYRRWLFDQMKSGNQAVIDAMEKLTEESLLGCFCSPLGCHGDIIIRAWYYWKGLNRDCNDNNHPL